MKTLSQQPYKNMVVGIVCHDAGGAEVVSEWLLQEGVRFKACLEGPARKVFGAKFSKYENLQLETLLSQTDWMLCGSSWQSDLEKRAVRLAVTVGKSVAVFLEHWTNYEERFTTDGVVTLPSEIWVGDKEAQALATSLFPSIDIKLIDNPYLQRVSREIEKFRMCDYPADIDILYVCEPIREHAKIKYGDENFLGYTEESALKFFFENVHVFSPGPIQLTIRPHPSDPCSKYDWAKAYNTAKLFVTIGGRQPLVEEIMRAKIVVGCESMAMVVALMAGRSVYSSIPSGGRNCTLPHEGIIKMKDLFTS